MGLGIGYASYVSFIMQSAFGTVGTPTVTAANMRTGTVFDPGQVMQARVTTTSAVQRASQLWKQVALTNWSTRFEYVSSPIWKSLLTAAFGKRTATATDVPPRIYTVNDPPVDPSSADTTTIFYNRSLTLRHTIHDGTAEVKTYVAQDCCVNRFQLFFEANKPVEMEFSGTGQVFAASTAPAYSDVTGTLLTWTHAAKSANAGIYISATNPPALNGADSAIIRRATFTLENNLRFEPFLGAVAGQELKLPTRAGHPTASLDIEADFDGGLSGVDAVDITADFIAQTAKNLLLRYYVGATDYMELKATGTVAPAIVDAPKPLQNSDGAVGFSATYRIFPDTITDLALSVNTAT